MPAFLHERLTAEQITSCQRFHLKVFGTLMFPSEPVCNGKHGWGCESCWTALKAQEDARVAPEPVRQPWQPLGLAA